MSAVALVSFTTLDLNKLLPLVRQALNRSISAPADASGTTPPLHHMLCIAAIKNKNMKGNAAAAQPYLDMFHAGFFVAAREEDFAEIMEIAALPCVSTDTVARGIKAAYMAGTIAQWQQAILRGCVTETTTAARQVFNDIYKALCKVGLGPALQMSAGKPREDNTSLIEYKKN